MIPPDAAAALRKLYTDLDDAMSALSVRCQASGRCCRFAEFDHTLFVSALEVDTLYADADAPTEDALAAAGDAGCPYQQGRLCTAREHRPLGCRIFFCEVAPESVRPLEDLSAEFHARLKKIHETYSLPWIYQPLCTALTAGIARLAKQ